MTNHTAYVLTDTEKKLCITLGALSCFGALVIILSYVLFKQLRSLWRWLLVWLSIFDFIQGAFYIFNGLVPPSALSADTCAVVGLANVLSCLCSFLCTACISYVVVDVVSMRQLNSEHAGNISLKRFYAIFLGYPALIGFIIISMHVTSMGDVITVDLDQYGCYINHDYEWLRMIATYIPCILTWVFTLVFYIRAVRRLAQVSSLVSVDFIEDDVRRTRSNSRAAHAVLRSVMWRLSLIPLGFVMLRLPDVMYRVMELFFRPSEMLQLRTTNFGQILISMQAALNPAQGLWNMLLFVVFPESVRQRFVDCCSLRLSQSSHAESYLLFSRASENAEMYDSDDAQEKD